MAIVHDWSVARSHLAVAKGGTWHRNSEVAGTRVELPQVEGGVQMIAEPDSQRPNETEDRAHGQHENGKPAQPSHHLCLISPTSLLSPPKMYCRGFWELAKGPGHYSPSQKVCQLLDGHSLKRRTLSFRPAASSAYSL